MSLIIHVQDRPKKGERLTLAARLSPAKGKGNKTIVWPVQEPVFITGAAGKKLRTKAYFDAMGKVSDLLDEVAEALSTGAKVYVWIGKNVVCEYDPAREVYSNVVAVSDLADVCDLAEKVNIESGSQDPRDYRDE